MKVYLKTYPLILNDYKEVVKITEKARYVNISVPDKLAKAIDEYIKDNPDLDLRSRAQVVNFSLRMLFVKKKK